MYVDIAIVGGGIAGLSVAMELSKYNIDVAVIEKNNDVGLETTSTNHNLICQGADSLSFRPGTLHAELNIKSIPLWPKLSKNLNFKFKRIGGIWLIRDKVDYQKFLKLKSRSFKQSTKPDAPYYIPKEDFTPVEFIDRKTVLDMEPYINKDILGALYDPNLATVDPKEVAKAYAENANYNGVKFLLNTEVKMIRREGIGFSIETNNGNIKASFVINAAGINIDRIADFVKAKNFSYVPLKGTITDFDEEIGKMINHEVHVLPRNEAPNMVTALPTIHGNFRSGIYMELTYRSNNEVTKYAVDYNINVAKKLFPDINFENHIIKSFTGFMAYTNPDTGWHDFVIDIPEYVPNWINILLGPAGVSASPMIGKYVVELIKNTGFKIEEKSNYSPTGRKVIS
ncbi:putative dehydrogenase [Caldisphaera lagunensis DSM 15908]|uniref:Putative dehydrogenase n=1 Tax=Caldisphaera lagunensis (strain DSM 15908 / JCM 11604 / ANMR 0165 / IC-154) TaxID=1056495 RepID=L0A818_CALLD|nr:FAD-dependent oxidoreductase [Caldisphaera lagunensis]AFZ69976.1 putative dehydrogenase [Caldisphaera lagunensis DSM 15908]